MENARNADLNKKVSMIDILVVEDNEDDIRILEKVFENMKLLNIISVVRNGQEALDYIYHLGKYASSVHPAPGLILLDIRMPIMDGFEVLAKLKSDPEHRKIPVIILTTSDREEDIAKSYENGACSFVTKPVSFFDFIKIMERFEIYWTLVSKIPEVK